ncbi:2-amino-4-hydroxy-6-hydroxymethyldihydropteridine diphosphokinase [Sunxiuqinia sp. A32]|uniref:2-amino-4-hydroxy-6- hydroxymethyldihydropteridine diphosphokinase n=1 Tax=Sunxiuqinia sp. A32 TaxID=3461496 RepID=UPI00404622E3
MNTAIVAIGSNIESEKNISRTIELLGNDVELIQLSEMKKTKPIGIENQAEFTNGAVKIKTKLGKEELNRYLKDLEDKLGRDRSAPKFGPRCIDLDILIFNDQIVDEDYYTRDFLRDSAKELGFNSY